MVFKSVSSFMTKDAAVCVIFFGFIQRGAEMFQIFLPDLFKFKNAQLTVKDTNKFFNFVCLFVLEHFVNEHS